MLRRGPLSQVAGTCHLERACSSLATYVLSDKRDENGGCRVLREGANHEYESW